MRGASNEENVLNLLDLLNLPQYRLSVDESTGSRLGKLGLDNLRLDLNTWIDLNFSNFSFGQFLFVEKNLVFLPLFERLAHPARMDAENVADVFK